MVRLFVLVTRVSGGCRRGAAHAHKCDTKSNGGNGRRVRLAAEVASKVVMASSLRQRGEYFESIVIPFDSYYSRSNHDAVIHMFFHLSSDETPPLHCTNDLSNFVPGPPRATGGWRQSFILYARALYTIVSNGGVQWPLESCATHDLMASHYCFHGAECIFHD